MHQLTAEQPTMTIKTVQMFKKNVLLKANRTS